MRVEEVGGVEVPLKGERAVSAGLDAEGGVLALGGGEADGLGGDEGRGSHLEGRAGAGDGADLIGNGEGVKAVGSGGDVRHGEGGIGGFGEGGAVERPLIGEGGFSGGAEGEGGAATGGDEEAAGLLEDGGRGADDQPGF